MLDEFKLGLADLIKSIKFRSYKNSIQEGSNGLQVKIKGDIKKLREDPRILVDADKTQNKYLMKLEDYRKLLKKSIEKDYRKAAADSVKKVDSTIVSILFIVNNCE